MLDSFKRHALVIAALAFAALSFTPREAHASREADMLPDLLAINAVFGSVALFGTIDIFYMARSEPLPTGWAIAQLAIPTPIFLGLAAFHDGGYDGASGVRATCAILGVWFLGHAVVSLLLPRPEPPLREGQARAAPPRTGTAQLDASLVPTSGGAMVLGRLRL